MKLHELIDRLQKHIGDYPEPEVRIGLSMGEIVGIWRISGGTHLERSSIVIEAEDPNDKE